MLRLFALFISSILLAPIGALANISISPFFIELDAASRNRTGQVRFTNTSDKTQTYNIKIVNFKQESDGSYTALASPIIGNPFAEPYLEWSPHQVTLAPHQSQVVRIQRRPMATASDAEYVSHLLIQEQEMSPVADAPQQKNGINIQLTALYGVSIPIMIENGELSAGANIESTQIIDRGGKLVARVRVKRSGTRSFYGTLVVKDKSHEYGRVEKFRIFMTTPNRVIDIPLMAYPPRGTDVILIDEKTNETLETKRI